MPDIMGPHIAVTRDLNDDRTEHLTFGCDRTDCTSLKAKAAPSVDAVQAEPVVVTRPSTEKQL
jgi:hypothetical protein